MEGKIRLGILGLGNMGSGHTKNIFAGKCPEVELTAAADINPARLDWLSNEMQANDEHPAFDVKLFSNCEDMIASGLIDALVIAVPHYDHPKYAMEAMKAGIAVMSEKPAGVYTKQVRDAIRVADETGVCYAIMMNQRTNCVYRKMRELVQGGALGKILRTNWIITDWYRPSAYYASGDWRATWSGEGGGVLLNQCPHNLDLWQWICGMPCKVTANLQFGKWHDIEVEDAVTAFVEYENGATGCFITTTGEAPGTNRLEVTLEKGKIVAEKNPKTGAMELHLWENDETISEFDAHNTSAFGHPKCTYSLVETDGKNEQHVGVLNAFAAHLLRGEPLVADGREGINGLSISNAMHLSSWLGKTVSLPLDDDLYYEELKKRIAVSRRKTTGKTVTTDLKGSF